MSQAFLALIDRRGLRALLPENSAGRQLSATLQPLLAESAIYWAVLSDELAPALETLLEQDESEEALDLLRNLASSAGPISREFLGNESPTFSLL